MALNENLSFKDVRYPINARVSKYDPELSFVGYPDKVLLNKGEVLVRLDFPIVFGIFTRVWWMKNSVLQGIIRGADPGSTALRRAWQQQQAMPKLGKAAADPLEVPGRESAQRRERLKPEKGPRTQILEIVITQPSYAWIGLASPLFHRTGGAEQVYLPNLASGTGPDQSDYASLRHTYTLPWE